MTWDEGTFQAHSANISATGIFIETTNFPPICASVRLDFEVSGAAQKQTVRAKGRVVRHVMTQIDDQASPGFGTWFEQVSGGEAALFDFLGARMRKTSAPRPAVVETRKQLSELVAASAPTVPLSPIPRGKRFALLIVLGFLAGLVASLLVLQFIL